MSEDDRAAKAARAKAMLSRRRQQQQKVGASGEVEPPVPSTPKSIPQALSSQSSEHTQAIKERDPAELFTKNNSDASWLSSPPSAKSPSARVTSPPARVTSPPARVASPRSNKTATQPPKVVESSNGIESTPELGRQISSLKSENITLKAEVERLNSSKLSVESKLEATFQKSQQAEAHYNQQRQNLETQLENERQTVSLLVAEKSNLTEELLRLEGVERKANALEKSLFEEQAKASDFGNQVAGLQTEVRMTSDRLHQLQASEKELNDKCRDQERKLQLANGSISELQKEADTSRRRVRELEEQIQSDDRVEHLEESLKNTQNRADELEFQLSKLRQTHSILKTERDDLEQQCRALKNEEVEWQQKNTVIQEESTRIAKDIISTTTARDNLATENATLRTKLKDTESSVAVLQGTVDQTASELASQMRQLQALQVDLRAATRRADEAEKIQKDLQLESSGLLRSLDEMRPKIVELTSEKLNLTEKVGDLENAVRDRENTIAQFELSLQEAQDKLQHVEKQWQAKWSQCDKDHLQESKDLVDLQKAHAELQDQFENAMGSVRNMETERAAHHQEVVRSSNEVERLNSTLEAQKAVLAMLRKEVEARRLAQDEERDFLEQARNEIETLRSELSAKEEECQRLQKYASSPGTDTHSLDDELVNSLRQQYALDMSAAQSQIRALEDSVFSAEAKVHTLQKQVSFLEDQLKQTRTPSRLANIPSRPASRNETDLRRSSFGSHRTSNLTVPPLSRSMFEQTLSPETMHKRRISLSMLKARIDSERAAAASSHPPSRALSPVHSLPDSSSHPLSPVHNHLIHQPRFLDDSHVFWCSSCQGDLVIL